MVITIDVGEGDDLKVNAVACPIIELASTLRKLGAEKALIMLRPHPESNYGFSVQILEILKTEKLTNITFTTE